MNTGDPDRAIMQRENERSRMVAMGKRADDGQVCTLLLVGETGGGWCIYPHGVGTLGVRVPATEAQRLARAILGGAS
ncbi:MAG: hypothetical protein ACRDSP_05655 [Pseudonocardiaceae bacterium]